MTQRNCNTCRWVSDHDSGCEVVDGDNRDLAREVDTWIERQDWSGPTPEGWDCGFAWPVETADGCPGWVRR